MHIPRTAGTSMRAVAEYCFSVDATLQIYGDFNGIPFDAIAACPRPYVRGRELLFGHFAFGAHRQIGVRKPAYLTVLRDPIDLLASYLAFMELVEPDDPFLDNPLTRYLSGVGYDLPFGAIGRAHVEQAKENVAAHFIHVGTTVNLQATVDWLTHLFGRPKMAAPQVNQSTRKKIHLADRVAFAHDMELYNWCRLADRTHGNLERLYLKSA